MGATAARRSPAQRRRIQIVFQDPLSSLNPRMRCGASVTRAIRHSHRVGRSEAMARCAALFDRLGLEREHLDRFPRQLSGGQQQRVAIARAFAAEPDLLICDEVTSALDAAVQGQVLDLLQELQADSGCAILLITHDLAVLRRMAARTLVLERGEIVEQGETGVLFAEPRSRATQALLAASRQIELRANATPEILEKTA